MFTGDAVTRPAPSSDERHLLLLADATPQPDSNIQLAQAQTSGRDRYVFDGSSVLNGPATSVQRIESSPTPAPAPVHSFNQKPNFQSNSIAEPQRGAPVDVPPRPAASSSGEFVCNDNSYTCQSAMRMMAGYKREMAARGFVASVPDWGLETASAAISLRTQLRGLQDSAPEVNANLANELDRARLRGIGTLGLGIVANALIDRNYFPNDRPSWLTIGADVALPAIATFMPGRALMKVATMVGGHVIAKYIDHQGQKDAEAQELKEREGVLLPQ
jgi:hypothetical protein